MTGMERNSDIIIMSAYAPMLVNVNPGGMQWESDLIGYDTLNSYGSPSYYAQAMFASTVGTDIVDTKLEGGGPRFFYSVTKDPAKGSLIVKVVNGSSTAQPVEFKLEGASGVKSTAKVTSLTGNTTQETNSITTPKKIVPVAGTIQGVAANFKHVVPAYSIQVIEIATK